GLRQPSAQKFGQRVQLVLADMPVEVGVDVLDENLAPQLLAEEADVPADDRTEVEQNGRFALREGGQKLAKGFRRESLRRREARDGRIGVSLAGIEAIEQTHGIET